MSNDLEVLARGKDRARDLIATIDRSPTPYHAVFETTRRLEGAGFFGLDERTAWTLAPGDRRFVTRGGSTLIAFQVGQADVARSGFRVIGAHTDSPNLKVKPRAAFAAHGYQQLGVEIYGGVLLSTWLDRDLSIAGRVFVRGDRGIEARLIDFARPLLRIPNLAIHLDRAVNADGLKLNAQNHMPPILAIACDGTQKHAPDRLPDRLSVLLGKELDVAPAAILDHDLSLYDTHKGTLSGEDSEFVQIARLDNLASCYAGCSALLETLEAPADATRVLAFYDHEEVGSRSAQGAQGPFLEETLRRIVDAQSPVESQNFSRAIASSFLVSADMAHAVHPNYSEKHEPRHQPVLGKGPVIKSNAAQSYATDGESAARFHDLCREAGVTPQAFVARTDLGCGSTIGPITAARLGIKTVDVGAPMLSMHSIREMAGTADVELMHRVLVQFFR